MTVSVNSRVVTVKGPRGELTRRFKHTDAEMEIIGGKKRKLKVTIWFGKRKNLACIRTICTHIKNMIVGVTKVRLIDPFIHWFTSHPFSHSSRRATSTR